MDTASRHARMSYIPAQELGQFMPPYQMPYYDDHPGAMYDPYGCGESCVGKKFGKTKINLKPAEVSGISSGLAQTFGSALVDHHRTVNNELSKNNLVNPALFGINIAVRKRRRRSGRNGRSVKRGRSKSPKRSPSPKKSASKKKSVSRRNVSAQRAGSGSSSGEEFFYDDE